jgi:hypothetical protein
VLAKRTVHERFDAWLALGDGQWPARRHDRGGSGHRRQPRGVLSRDKPAAAFAGRRLTPASYRPPGAAAP